MLTPPLRSRGFTLVELMVTITLAAIMMALMAPSLRTFGENNKIRSTAENLAAGLQEARSEAVRRNAQVEFIMTNAEPNAANVNTTNLTASGANWMVRTKDPADATSVAYILLAGKSFHDGSAKGGAASTSIAGVSDGTAIHSVIFNNLSNTNLGAPAVFTVSNPSAGACSAEVRCLNVRVAASGQVRICDPLVTAANDPRKC